MVVRNNQGELIGGAWGKITVDFALAAEVIALQKRGEISFEKRISERSAGNIFKMYFQLPNQC